MALSRPFKVPKCVGDDFLAKRQPQRQVSPILANLKAKTATKCVTKQNYMNHMKEINETQ